MKRAAPKNDTDPLSALALTLRTASPPSAKLSKEHKQFNKLLKDIEILRASLGQWRDLVPVLQSRVATEIEPLITRYRERRVQLVMVLSHAVDGHELSKRQKSKAIEIMQWHLTEILKHHPDEELIALYDKYAKTSFEEEQLVEADILRDMASEVFGLDLDEDDAAETLNADDLAHLIAQKLDAEEQADAVRRKAGRKQSPKAQAQEDLRQQLAQGARQTVREIYRKLASELHPDRELDQDKRLHKTTLMQQANEAYAKSDLLTLLGLQLQTAQLDSAALGTLARERLQQYNHLLSEQCQQLRAELHDLSAPFAMNMTGGWGEISPAEVSRALDREVREYQRAAKDCEADIAHYQDIRNIKKSLNAYYMGQLDEDFPSPFDEILFEAPPPPRRRRR